MLYYRERIQIKISREIRLPGGSDGKESTCNAGDLSFDPGVRKIPWRRKRQPTPVFLPRKSHGQRSLVGYSPWGCKELDTTERLTLSLSDYSQEKSARNLQLSSPGGVAWTALKSSSNEV